MPGPARIAVNGKFLQAGPTGVHRVAWELMRALDAGPDPRFAFRVLSPRGPSRYPDLPRLPRDEVGRLRGQAWEQIDLPRAAPGETILSLGNLAPVWPRDAVTMIHDAQVFTTPASYSRAFGARYRLLLRAIGRRHRRILTVSAFSKAQLVAFGIAPGERIDVIHNGVDHLLEVTPDRAIVAKLGLVRQGYVLALANTQRHKNVGLLLRAFARPDLAGLKLVLVGGATRDDFVAAGHEVPAGTLFAGAIPDKALRGLIADALCLAFPSLTEGFGLPPLEAMLLGCPALVAPCGALPEVCGDAALYADPDAPEAWARAILALADDRLLWDVRSVAGQAHAARFTWAAAAVKLRDSLARATMG